MSSVVSDRICWVCYCGESDPSQSRNVRWNRPCRCRGELKWVHSTCITRWIDEKQKGNFSADVHCPICKYQYIIVYPPAGFMYTLLQTIDIHSESIADTALCGVLIGVIYWSAVTYGAVTVMQVYGHSQGLMMMEQTYPLLLLLGLPTIPVILLALKRIPWQSYIIRFWRGYIIRLPIIRSLLPNEYENSPQWQPPSIGGYSARACRYICSALSLPTVATLTGRIFFSKVRSDAYRACLGGLAYVLASGMLDIYYLESRFVHANRRQVVDYEEE